MRTFSPSYLDPIHHVYQTLTLKLKFFEFILNVFYLEIKKNSNHFIIFLINI